MVGYLKTPIGVLEIKGDTAINSINLVSRVGKENTNKIIEKCKAELIQYFAGTLKQFTVPIYQEGTEFQQLVWDRLSNTKYGKTYSYKELAKMCGNEKASRAVGNANNKNKLLIIVPCHRIIASDGSLGGYALGLKAKQILLDIEKGK